MIYVMFRWVFAPVTLLCVLVLGGCGEDLPKSYPVLDAPVPPTVPGAETSATIILEMIEIDGVKFSEWQLANTLEPTRATPLRRSVQDWLREDKARLVETVVVHGKDGARSETKSVSEIVYPDEYRYPTMKTTETVTDPKDGNKTKTTTVEERMSGVAATGHAFATREAGTVLEVDCWIDSKARTVKIELAAELVHYFGNLEWQAVSGEDVDRLSAPVFDKNSFRTSLVLQSGVYGIVGSGAMPEAARSRKFSNPTLLVFVRADLNLPSQ